MVGSIDLFKFWGSKALTGVQRAYRVSLTKNMGAHCCSNFFSEQTLKKSEPKSLQQILLGFILSVEKLAFSDFLGAQKCLLKELTRYH